MKTLFEEWKERRDLKYESRYHDTIVNPFCQWHGGSDDGREGKGRIFNAGYEAFIYAFFIGLYANKRSKLDETQSTKSFSMEVYRLGSVKESSDSPRKKYKEIQEYIFLALLAKTDINLCDLDLGKLSMKDAVDALMLTFNEYANGGFEIITSQMLDKEDFFYSSENVLSMITGQKLIDDAKDAANK